MKAEQIAARAAREVRPGMVINLGIGLPTKVVKYLPEDQGIMIHSENGIFGVSETASGPCVDQDLIDAGGAHITVRKGAAFMDSAVSFALIRGGGIDIAMLGAFQVDEMGNLANWKIPRRHTPGIGGAMELAQYANRVIVLCSHTDKAGQPKLVRRCSLPLTAPHCVSRIITELGVFDVHEGGFLLRELVDGVSLDDVKAATGAKVTVAIEEALV
ncbi:MAG: 3-oxoacid CoA-transferase subunit B [Lysobacterales bacterium]|jgi:3-oxoacid CoA-transferase subunit B